ncbi:MAG: gamma-butyrobetaine hydroxylase-like domain-containing protein [Phycisphaerales bacterium]
MDPTTPEPRPQHLDVNREKGMTVRWDDGVERFLSVGDLRRHSPSADAKQLREQLARNPLTVLPASKASGPLAIAGVEPVGHYALRIRFTDGHDTGIYSWRYLRALCDSHGKPAANG